MFNLRKYQCKVAVLFYTPSAVYETSSCSTSQLSFVLSVFNFSYSSGHAVVSHHGCNPHFPDRNDADFLFYVLVGNYFGMCLFKYVFCLFSYWVVLLLSCRSSLYILNRSPLSDICAVACLCTLLMVSFKTKIFSFGEAQFINFLFKNHQYILHPV